MRYLPKGMYLIEILIKTAKLKILFGIRVSYWRRTTKICNNLSLFYVPISVYNDINF